MYLGTIIFCLAAVVALYFYNNPMGHGRWFMMRRFINWFPLGMTYAFLCMGRYNLIVAKSALGTLMSKEDLGIIFGVGTWVYALSFLVNGPLIDKKLGGKRGMIISALGASLANVALGVLTWLIVAKHLKVNLVASFSVLYALNMYFQSFGSMSIIKVKAYWFHVRERGVFGAIFGTLISIGVYFAFDWGSCDHCPDEGGCLRPAPHGFCARRPALGCDLGGVLHSGGHSDRLGAARLVAHQGLAGGGGFPALRHPRRLVRPDARRIQHARPAEKSFRQPADVVDCLRRADGRGLPLQHDAVVHHFCR